MKYCVHCETKISGEMTHCPLCKRQLSGSDGRSNPTYPSYRELKEEYKQISQLISFGAIALMAILVVFNLAFNNQVLWCVPVNAYIMYAWLLGLLTFKKNVHLGLKLISHALVIPLLLLLVNSFGIGTGTFQKLSWSLSYTMPITISAFILTFNVLIFKFKSLRKDFIIYQLILCVLAFVPFGLVLGGLAEPVLPSALVAGVSFLTMTGMVIFMWRSIRNEFTKKFHTK